MKPIRVYPAGPINGGDVLKTLANIENGIRATADLLDQGYAPFPVFSDFLVVMRLPNLRIEQVYAYSLAWLECSEAVLMLEGWENSHGAQHEHVKAEGLGIPVFYSMDDLNGWRDAQERAEKVMARSDD